MILYINDTPRRNQPKVSLITLILFSIIYHIQECSAPIPKDRRNTRHWLEL